MNAIFEILNPNNTVTINRPLAHAIGLNEAIIFAALAAKQSYYAERAMLDEDGWFYCTVDDLHESTALSKYQQSAAVKNLVEVGLIEMTKKGLPARRYFRVNENTALLEQLLNKGEKIITKLNPLANSSRKTEQQEVKKFDDKTDKNSPTSREETERHTYYNLNNKSENINQDQSIYPAAAPLDVTDRIDNSSREEFLEIIRENIDYDYFEDKKQVDELVEIMLDVVCSNKTTLRVNGEDMPSETVKSRFLMLDSSHIDYVLTALKKSPSDIRNIRAYLITALYNAPATIDNYYAAWVNYDMHGT